jgi:hypothetical protein
MAKIKPTFTIESYGIYDVWEGNNKSLPQISKVTTLIPAVVDIEFGLTVRVKKGKGKTIQWVIEHPNITDKNGRPMAVFEGEEYVRNNDWVFYLGDTIWAPIEDKLGPWYMYLSLDGKIFAEKLFEVTAEDIEEENERKFWKRRGF